MSRYFISIKIKYHTPMFVSSRLAVLKCEAVYTVLCMCLMLAASKSDSTLAQRNGVCYKV